MDFVNLLSNIFSSGTGAFAGALAAYYWACRKDEQRDIADYLSLLLVIHEHMTPLYELFSDIPPEVIKETDGKKFVSFDLPFPSLNLSTSQMQRLFEISPDKDMPATLIQMQHFLNTQAQRLKTDGIVILSLDEIQLYARQLKGMLLSVQVQYEQQSNSAFPLDGVIPHTHLQTKQ